MKQLSASFAGFVRDARGATSIEYAFIACLISIAIIGAATQIGTNVNELFAGLLPGGRG